MAKNQLYWARVHEVENERSSPNIAPRIFLQNKSSANPLQKLSTAHFIDWRAIPSVGGPGHSDPKEGVEIIIAFWRHPNVSYSNWSPNSPVRYEKERRNLLFRNYFSYLAYKMFCFHRATWFSRYYCYREPFQCILIIQSTCESKYAANFNAHFNSFLII